MGSIALTLSVEAFDTRLTGTMADRAPSLKAKPGASHGNSAEQAEWRKIDTKYPALPTSVERKVLLSVSFTPVGIPDQNRQLPIVKAGVLWLKNGGYEQWRADGDLVLDPGTNVSCEVGANGFAGYQCYMEVRSRCVATPIPPADIAEANKLRPLSKKFAQLEKLRNTSEIATRWRVSTFLKSSRGLP